MITIYSVVQSNRALSHCHGETLDAVLKNLFHTTLYRNYGYGYYSGFQLDDMDSYPNVLRRHTAVQLNKHK